MTADPPMGTPFRVAVVPGVKPVKWSRLWRERVARVRLELVPVSEPDQVSVLRERLADMAFVRFPAGRPPTEEGLHVIPLYRESTETDTEGSQIGLAWLAGPDDVRTETFIGIVRGRTARSSRGRPG